MPARIERLPFTVYDIMGYLVPGAYLAIYASMFFFGEFVAKVMALDWSQVSTILLLITLFLIEGYILGHALAIVSAETIERLCVGFFGYPSETLFLEKETPGEISRYVEEKLSNFKKRAWLAKILIMLLFLPYTATLRLLSETGLYRLVIKPLGRITEEKVKANFKKLFDKEYDELSPSERFRMIDYFNFARGMPVSARQYNYVTLYGFCRNISLALYIVWLLEIYHSLIGFSNAFYDSRELGADIAFNLVLSQILLVSYLKFFRRYSQDSFLAFAVEREAMRVPGTNG